MKRATLALAAIVALMLCGAVRGSVEDFEGFTTGQSVNGQGGWTVEDQWGNTMWDDDPAEYDQQVTDDGTGNTVWRVSNAVTTGGLSDQPMSQIAPQAAGETDAALWNDKGPEHDNQLSPPNPGRWATTPYFYGAFDVRSATGGAQAGLSISVSTNAKQIDGRQSYISLSDDGADGIDVGFYETGHTGDVWGGSAVFTEVASDLSYTEWHRIEILMQFVDGLEDVGGDLYGNDIVTIKVDGDVVHTGSGWETNWAGRSDGLDKQGVDCLNFALRGAAAPDNVGDGFYIDNVEISNIPEPATMGLLGLGLVGLVARRKKT